MKNYKVNIVEYEEILEGDGKPFQMLLNPLTLAQLKEGLVNGFTSYIRDERQARFLGRFLGEEVIANKSSYEINQEEVFIAIRYMGEDLPEDFKYLKPDHDIEIYYIKMLDYNI